eukprot:1043127-Pelagomonas_calceolata.AAC.1
MVGNLQMGQAIRVRRGREERRGITSTPFDGKEKAYRALGIQRFEMTGGPHCLNHQSQNTHRALPNLIMPKKCFIYQQSKTKFQAMSQLLSMRIGNRRTKARPASLGACRLTNLVELAVVQVN